MKKINESWAISLRIDGSVDSTHIDKIYVMAKVINLNGSPEQLFIGIGEQKERKAVGLKNAVMEAIKTATGDHKFLLSRVSSLCTNGASVNMCDRSSLWTLLDDAVKIDGSTHENVVCCSSSGSSMGRRCRKTQPDRQSPFRSIQSFQLFQSIGAAHCRVEKIGEENKTAVHKIPKFFVIYFERNKDRAVCAGNHRYLSNSENLKMIAFQLIFDSQNRNSN